MTATAPPRLRRHVARLRFGFVLAVLGGFWTVAGTMMALFPTPKMPPGTGWLNAALAVALLLGPGLYLWLSARAKDARSEKLERVAALASVEGRMPLGDAAATLGVGMAQARVLLLDAVAAGLVDGRIDAEKNVFLVSSGAAPVSMREVVCGTCGGRSSVSVRAGETPACGYCGGLATPAAP